MVLLPEGSAQSMRCCEFVIQEIRSVNARWNDCFGQECRSYLLPPKQLRYSRSFIWFQVREDLSGGIAKV